MNDKSEILRKLGSKNRSIRLKATKDFERLIAPDIEKTVAKDYPLWFAMIKHLYPFP